MRSAQIANIAWAGFIVGTMFSIISAGGMLSKENLANLDVRQLAIVLISEIVALACFFTACFTTPPRPAPPTFQDIYEGKA